MRQLDAVDGEAQHAGGAVLLKSKIIDGDSAFGTDKVCDPGLDVRRQPLDPAIDPRAAQHIGIGKPENLGGHFVPTVDPPRAHRARSEWRALH